MNRNIFLSIGLIVQCINISNIKTASIPISHQHIDSLAITNVENDPTYESKFEDDKVTSLLNDFSLKDYDDLLKRIKQLDDSIYDELVTYAKSSNFPAFKKAETLTPTVLVSSEDERRIPYMILSPDISDNDLELYLGSYRALRKELPTLTDIDTDSNQTSIEESDDSSVEQEDDDNGETRLFSSQEHEEYMELIKEMDPDLYAILPKSEHVILPANKDEANNVSIFETEEYPFFVIQSLAGKSEREKKEIFKPLLEEAHELLEKQRRSKGILPRNLYEHYLELAKEIDENFYHNLIACEQALHEPCIREGKPTKILTPTKKTHWFPRIILSRHLESWPRKEQIDYLALFRDYKPLPPITQEERDVIFKIIQSLAPDLYEELYKTDPTFISHLKRYFYEHNGVSITTAPNGLPLIEIGEKVITESEKTLSWTIAHELGHYFYGHHQDNQIPSHKYLEDEDTDNDTDELLPFKETFQNRQRQQEEYEADIFAITHMRIPLEHALEALESIKSLSKDDDYEDSSSKKAFLTTHPVWTRTHKGNSKKLNDDIESFGRIAHTKGLKREIERLQLQGNYPRHVDWKLVIQKHHNELGLDTAIPQEKPQTTSGEI